MGVMFTVFHLEFKFILVQLASFYCILGYLCALQMKKNNHYSKLLKGMDKNYKVVCYLSLPLDRVHT